MPRQLQVFLLPANFESDGMTSRKHELAAKTVSKWRPSKSPLSRRISSNQNSGTSEAKTSLSGKAECFLAIGEDKKTL